MKKTARTISLVIALATSTIFMSAAAIISYSHNTSIQTPTYLHDDALTRA